MNRLSFVLVTLAGLCCMPPTHRAAADDWPQHLGPTQDAVSADTGLLDRWPEQGPPERWRHDVGIGFAGVAVVDGRVYLNDRDQATGDILRVFDLDSGRELWRFEVAAPGRVNFPGSRSTPCVTDTHAYLTGPMGHVTAVNLDTRRADWSFNIYDRYPDENKMFGFAPSPVMADGLLLLSPTAEGDPVVIAVDPATGLERWASDATLTTLHSHHTPVVRTLAGVRGIACRDQTHVYFIDLQNGKTLWSQEVYEIKRGPHVTIPPVTVTHSYSNRQQTEFYSTVLVTNGYENGTVALDVLGQRTAEPDASIRLSTRRERWRIPEGSQVHPPVFDPQHGYLYMNINENANLKGRDKQGGLACISRSTGEIKWRTGNDPNLNRGALTIADGKIYAFDGDTGELILINPTPQKYDPIASFVAIEPKGRSNNAWSPIVITDGRLIIRDHQQIVCYDLRKH
ncbi:MAG: PQQ-binding-like beta-propeller repeat protein [Phycisphaeraceae bacterium]